MTRTAAFRGQPLLVLSVLLLGWMVLRASFWQSPFAAPEAAVRIAGTVRGAIRAMGRPQRSSPRRVSTASASGIRPIPAAILVFERTAPILSGAGATLILDEAGPAATPAGPLKAPGGVSLLSGRLQAGTPSAAVADAALAQRSGTRSPSAAPMIIAAAPRRDGAPRWSADAWLLVRRDMADSILIGRPGYGRSQAGAVVRYRLSETSPRRPQAYLRTSAALAGASQQEIAAGVSARPLAAVPLRLSVEVRAGQTALGTRVRPAAFVVTELVPLSLPLGARAEAYAQGGYVGGDHATAFVDGQARVERPVLRHGESELTAGGGIWGGAQSDAARLDVGPTAAFSFRLGGARGRVTADYRFRVGGDAAPSSGPALTLSAGF